MDCGKEENVPMHDQVFKLYLFTINNYLPKITFKNVTLKTVSTSHSPWLLSYHKKIQTPELNV